MNCCRYISNVTLFLRDSRNNQQARLFRTADVMKNKIKSTEMKSAVTRTNPNPVSNHRRDGRKNSERASANDQDDPVNGRRNSRWTYRLGHGWVRWSFLVRCKASTRLTFVSFVSITQRGLPSDRWRVVTLWSHNIARMVFLQLVDNMREQRQPQAPPLAVPLLLAPYASV